MGTLFWTNTALAAGSMFTVYPTYPKENTSWIVRDVNKGSQYNEHLTIENLSEEEISLSILSKKTTGSPDNIQIEKTKTAEWIKPSVTEIKLGAKEKKQIDINISIPENAQIGEYQGAIIVNHQSTEKNQLNISTEIGNRFYLNITDNTNLMTNTFSPPNINLHLLLIFLSIAGILYGLPIKKLTSQLIKNE